MKNSREILEDFVRYLDDQLLIFKDEMNGKLGNDRFVVHARITGDRVEPIPSDATAVGILQQERWCDADMFCLVPEPNQDSLSFEQKRDMPDFSCGIYELWKEETRTKMSKAGNPWFPDPKGK